MMLEGGGTKPKASLPHFVLKVVDISQLPQLNRALLLAVNGLMLDGNAKL